jgi:hypothetical protein
VRFRVSAPPPGRPWVEPPYLREDPSAPLEPFSRTLPPRMVFFHGVHLVRSSHDAVMGRMRRWRVPPIPVMPYVGPWPETLDVEDALPALTPGMVARWIFLSGAVLWARRLGRAGAALAGVPARRATGADRAPATAELGHAATGRRGASAQPG